MVNKSSQDLQWHVGIQGSVSHKHRLTELFFFIMDQLSSKNASWLTVKPFDVLRESNYTEVAVVGIVYMCMCVGFATLSKSIMHTIRLFPESWIGHLSHL